MNTTTAFKINCGCGYLVEGSNARDAKLQLANALGAAQQHCRETGHTMEILGTVQP